MPIYSTAAPLAGATSGGPLTELSGWSGYPTSGGVPPTFTVQPVSAWDSNLPAPPDSVNCIEINASSASNVPCRAIFDSVAEGAGTLPSAIVVAATTYIRGTSPAGYRGPYGRGTSPNSTTPTFYAAEFDHGGNLQLVQVASGTYTVLASLLAVAFIGDTNYTNFKIWLYIGDNPNTGNPSLRVVVQRFDAAASANAALNGYYYVSNGLPPSSNGNGLWQQAFGYAIIYEDSSANKITTVGNSIGVDHQAAQDNVFISGFSVDNSTVNTIPPSFTITSPANGATLSAPFTVNANFSCASGYVLTSAQLYYSTSSSGPWTAIGLTATPKTQTGTLAFHYDPIFLPDGTYYLSVQGIDSSLYPASSAALQVIVANGVTPPRPSLTPKSPNALVLLPMYATFGDLLASNTSLLSDSAKAVLNNVDVVITGPYSHTLRSAGFTGQVLPYTNVSNLYDQLLVHALNWADANAAGNGLTVSQQRESFFTHQNTQIPGGGTAAGSTVWCRNFWGAFVENHGTIVDLNEALDYGDTLFHGIQFTRAGSTFGPAQNDSVYVGFLDAFDTLRFLASTLAAGGATFSISVPTAFDANKVATGWTPVVSATISGVTNTTNPTVTTTAAHGLVVGQLITIGGVVGATGINGNWTIASVPSATTFTVTGSAPGAYTSGGTVLADSTVGFSRNGVVNWDAAAAVAAGWKAGYPRYASNGTTPLGYSDANAPFDGFNYPGLYLYWLKITTTSATGTGTIPFATELTAADYCNERSSRPVMPGWDASADANGDGILGPAEWPNRARGPSFIIGGITYNVPSSTYTQSGAAGLVQVNYHDGTPSVPTISITQTGNVFDVNLSTDSSGNSNATNTAIAAAINALSSSILSATVTGTGTAIEPGGLWASNGADARTKAQGRTFTTYGSQRLQLYPAGIGVKTWGQNYYLTQFTAGGVNALANEADADGFFVDNSGNFPGTAVSIVPSQLYESYANYNNEYAGFLVTIALGLPASTRGIRWLLPNVGGNSYSNGLSSARIEWACQAAFYEFLCRPAQHAQVDFLSVVSDLTADTNSPNAFRFLDFYPSGLNGPYDPPHTDSRVQLGMLAYASMLIDSTTGYGICVGQNPPGPWAASPGPIAMGNLSFTITPNVALGNVLFTPTPATVAAGNNVTINLSAASANQSLAITSVTGPTSGVYTVNVALATDGSRNVTSTDAQLVNLINTSSLTDTILVATLFGSGTAISKTGSGTTTVFINYSNFPGVVSIAYVGGVPNQAESATLTQLSTGWCLTVNLHTDGSGSSLSTDTTIAATIAANAATAALLTVTTTGAPAVQNPAVSPGFNWVPAITQAMGALQGAYQPLGSPVSSTPSSGPDAGGTNLTQYRNMRLTRNGFYIDVRISQGSQATSNPGARGTYLDPNSAVTINFAQAVQPVLANGQLGPAVTSQQFLNGQGGAFIYAGAGPSNPPGPPLIFPHNSGHTAPFFGRAGASRGMRSLGYS